MTDSQLLDRAEGKLKGFGFDIKTVESTDRYTRKYTALYGEAGEVQVVVELGYAFTWITIHWGSSTMIGINNRTGKFRIHENA